MHCTCTCIRCSVYLVLCKAVPLLETAGTFFACGSWFLLQICVDSLVCIALLVMRTQNVLVGFTCIAIFGIDPNINLNINVSLDASGDMFSYTTNCVMYEFVICVCMCVFVCVCVCVCVCWVCVCVCVYVCVYCVCM